MLIYASTSEAIPAELYAARVQTELLVSKQTWLNPKELGKVIVISKGTELLYFEPTDTVARQGHLMPAKSITEVRPNVPVYTLASNLSNHPVHVPEHIVPSRSSNSIVSIVEAE